MSKYIEGANPSQVKGILAVEGPVQINAVAGSGKSFVLTRRVGHMVNDLKMKPSSIMVTTFTKKATEELVDRLSTVVSKMALKQMTVGTSHSIGFRILAKEYENIGHHLAPAFKRRDGVIMNNSLKFFVEEVKKSIIQDRTVEFTVKEELSDIAAPQLMKAIGLSKNLGISAQDYEAENSGKGARMQAYVEFYLRYEQMKWSEKKIDCDDMLYLLIKLFEDHPEILKKYQKIYKYIMVDETQDNNTLQYKMVKMLAYPENNLFVVGDDDQCMYSFRGARPDQFIHFKDNFRNAQSISLEDNYRSNPPILNIAGLLIKNNTERIVKVLKPHKTDNSNCVSFSKYENEDEEAEGVVKEIQLLVEKESISCKDISILYRTNAQSRAFEDKLIISGLPYVIHGGISFYERKEIKDIVSYLQLAVDTSNDKAFERVINVPSRYLGKAFMEKVRAYNGSHYEAINGKISTKNYEKAGIDNFLSLVDTIKNMVQNHESPTDVVNFILEEGGYKKYILNDEEDEEESSRLENIETLKFVANKYENLQDFLDYIGMMTSAAKHSIDGVQLMSIHKSKGLGFPVIFVVGVSEGTLPHFKSLEAVKENTNPLAIEEERRLAYVAITRAESKVYLSSIMSFNDRPLKVSRFIKEMNLLNIKK